jgi:PAS domain S-box-containing protein
LTEHTINIDNAPIEQALSTLDLLARQIAEYFQKSRPASVPSHVYMAISQLQTQVAIVNKRIDQMAQERRRLSAVTEVSQAINSSLELDDVLQMVMDTIIHLTRAERGFLMLRDDNGEMAIRIARNWEHESVDASEQAFSRTVVNQVVDDGVPVLTTNAQQDPRFSGQQSVIALNLRSILCVPLRVKSDITGVVYTDNRIRSGLFTNDDLDLLAAFANQAAVAIENARLFVSVRQTLDEVTELKNLMNNVFDSIASGVLTADVEEKILLCNRAAEKILGLPSQEIVGHPLQSSLPRLSSMLEPHLEQIRTSQQPIQGLEASPTFPERGKVDLRLSLSPLTGVQQQSPGFAIVFEDETEKKRLEAQRRLFERMVSPAVIQQLNPDELALGGQRQQITVLFADIRGFTTFSESLQPEQLVKVLNRYLAAAAEAVLREEGTVDKFLGDAVMAWFNAPIPQPDHTLRAVRAALNIRSAILALHAVMPAEDQLSFGIGVHRGEAVLGLVGSERRLDYTAIGDSVNTARRIQENAHAGQVLITRDVYQEVADSIFAKATTPIQAKGKREPIEVYEVIGLR